MKIYKRKDGRYSCQVKRPDGKYKTIYGKTQREVRDKYNELITQFKTEPFVKPNKMGLKDWFEKWLEEYTIDLKYDTKLSYLTIFNHSILPYFGNKQIQKITTEDCQKFINEISKNLKPISVKIYTDKLKRVLNDAVKNGLISRTPMDGIILPKINKSEVRVIDSSEIRTFLEKAKKTYPRQYDIYEFLLLTGLRVSELIGLTIDNYNPKKHTLTIEKQYGSTENGKDFKPTKTNTIRTLLLSDRAEEIVKTRINRTEDLRKDNPDFNNRDFIFIQDKDKVYSRITLDKWLHNICDRNGLGYITVHDLRHTYATLTLALGGDIKTVQNNLGHSKANTTLDFYATSSESMKKELNNKLEMFWDSM